MNKLRKCSVEKEGSCEEAKKDQQKQVDDISDEEYRTNDESEGIGSDDESDKEAVKREYDKPNPAQLRALNKLKKKFESTPSISIINHREFSCSSCHSAGKTNMFNGPQQITIHLKTKKHLKNTCAVITEAEKIQIVSSIKTKFEKKGIEFPDHDNYYCTICEFLGKVDLRGCNIIEHLRSSRHNRVLAKRRENESKVVEMAYIKGLFNIDQNKKKKVDGGED